jgi:hypothetical protein
MPTTRHCVLIVDDEPDVCDSVHDLLRREFRVLKALETTGFPAPRALALCEDGFAMHPGLCGDDDSVDIPGLGMGSIRANAEVFQTRWPSTA